jgi:NAD(P)-dependent dehydrogenase (short-subunit alcohol dehydrogenase family)
LEDRLIKINKIMILKNKVALITGGSGHIGKAISRAFLREGAKVMIATRSIDELLAAKNELSDGSKSVEIYKADVADSADVKNLVEETLKIFGKIDILVNAAGIYGPIGPSLDVDFDKWKQTFEINVFGTFNLMQRVLPIMIKKGGGKIINFSGGGDGPFPRFSAYNSSKVAVVRLTETMAVEIKDYHIDINAIAPGPVNSRFLQQALDAGEEAVGKERYQSLIKQKNEGGVPPEKAADLCVFLASSASDSLTGKFLSAVWDDWKNWDKNKIAEIMQSDKYTLRRVK